MPAEMKASVPELADQPEHFGRRLEDRGPKLDRLGELASSLNMKILKCSFQYQFIPTSVVTAEFNPRFGTAKPVAARHIEDALSRAGGRTEGPAGAADLLEIDSPALWIRMGTLGVARRSFRPTAQSLRGRGPDCQKKS